MTLPASEYEKGREAETAVYCLLRHLGHTVLAQGYDVFPDYDLLYIDFNEPGVKVRQGLEELDIAHYAKTVEVKFDRHPYLPNIPIEVAEYRAGQWQPAGLVATPANYFAVFTRRDGKAPTIYLAEAGALRKKLAEAQKAGRPYGDRQTGNNPPTVITLVPEADFRRWAATDAAFEVHDNVALTCPHAIHPLTPQDHRYTTMPRALNLDDTPRIDEVPESRMTALAENRKRARQEVMDRLRALQTAVRG